MKPIGDRLKALVVGMAAALAIATNPVAAQQLESVDPDTAFDEGIDADLAPASTAPAAPDPAPTQAPDASAQGGVGGWTEQDVVTSGQPDATTEVAPAAQVESATYGEDDLIGEAEGVFGKGAEGLAKMIQSLLKEQGEPNAYIVGREAGGAIAFGLRYGSGTLHHKVEGERKVYWTGPSIGFDVGANAANTFVLVYNLFDSEDLYKRYPAGEGQAYVVGGLTASYLRRGDVVLIPIRMGAGLRLGVNAGYMKFSKKQRWLPF